MWSSDAGELSAVLHGAQLRPPQVGNISGMAGRILVGTSSWADPGFVRVVSAEASAKGRLPWYAQRFELVELNSSFYAVPDRSTVHGWVE